MTTILAAARKTSAWASRSGVAAREKKVDTRRARVSSIAAVEPAINYLTLAIAFSSLETTSFGKRE
jgi:hypothetical protein